MYSMRLILSAVLQVLSSAVWLFLLTGTSSKQASASLEILDTFSAVVYEDPVLATAQRSTYFGYSVLLHTNTKDNWLIVAAPRSNASILSNVREPGEVYRCAFKKPCKPILLDSKDTIVLKNQKVIEQKHGSWMGMTMAIRQKDGDLAVCAPRRYFDYQDVRLMQGSCYVKNMNSEEDSSESVNLHPLFDTTMITKLIPKTSSRVYFYGMAELGISAYYAATKDITADLVMGAPGIYNSAGSIVLMPSGGKYKDSIVPETDTNIRDGDYLGYSGTSGYFYDDNQLYHVAAAPRGNKYHGVVTVYVFPQRTGSYPIIKQELYGDKFGSYFGASLAAADFNKDGHDDLIVGAPYGSEPTVFIYHGGSRQLKVPTNNPALKMTQWGLLSQFGISLATTDFNNDGYYDAIVGAPEVRGRGAIAIFLGGASGLSVQPSQVVYAEDITSNLLRGFGMSLGQPVDIDGNNYPDLAVGSYNSGHAIVLRTIPEGFLSATLEQIGGDQINHVHINICIKYGDKYNTTRDIVVTRQLTVDFNAKRPVERFSDKKAQKTYRDDVRLSKNKEYCEEMHFKVKNDIDLQTPMDIMLSVSKMIKTKGKNPIMIKGNENIIDTDQFDKWNPRIPNVTVTKSFLLYNKCTGTCEVELSVDASFPDYINKDFVVGSNDSIQLEIVVKNKMNPAWAPEIQIELPPDTAVARLPPNCRSEAVVVCKLENPLPDGYEKVFHIDIDVKEIADTTDEPGIKMFTVNISSTSNDTNYADNSIEVPLHLTIDSTIVVAGKSLKDTYSYVGLSDSESTYEIIEFKHTYEVQKFGSSYVKEVLLEVNIPIKYHTSKKEIEFLRIYQPEGFQNGQPFTCERTDYNYAQKQGDDKEDTSSLPNFPNLNSAARMRRSVDFLKPSADARHHNEMLQQRNKRDVKEESLINPPVNRTLFIACPITGVTCHTISCQIGPFRHNQHVARLQITMAMNVSRLKETVMGLKDIISLTTNGAATITRGQVSGGSAEVTSIFVVIPSQPQVEMWIIILSVIIGLLVVLFLTIGLVKAGFFQRKKKEELEALKEAEANKKAPQDAVQEPLHDSDDFSMEEADIE